MGKYTENGNSRAVSSTGKNSGPKDWRRNLALRNRERIKDLLLAAGASAGAAYLFYRSVFGLVWGIVLIPYIWKARQQFRSRRRQAVIEEEFHTAMEAVSAALAAGYSVEMAWVEAQKELEKVCGRSGSMTQVFARMNQQVRMNEPLERLLLEFAYETGIEDICSFAEIFRYARRSGGDLTAIIRITLKRMREKKEIMTEIQTAVTARKLEQKMLLVLVPGILLFLTASSPEYAQVLYHTAIGTIAMTGCLAGYLAAAEWARRIVDIQI
jgi:tight adherence protein B